MAKRKNSKALFEVLSKGEEEGSSLMVPDWMKKKPDAGLDEHPPPEPHAETWKESAEQAETPDKPDEQAEQTEQAETPDEQAEQAETPDEQAEQVEAPDEPADLAAEAFEEKIAVDDEVEQPADTNEYEMAEPETPPTWAETVSLPPELPAAPAKPIVPPFSERREPILQIDDGRVRLSMNLVTSMVALGGVLVLLVAAFVIGRLTSPAPEAEPTAAAPPPTLPDKGTNLRTVDDKPVHSQPEKREAGRQYLMIETLRGRGDADFVEADRITKFCQKKGIPTNKVFLNDRLAIWCLLGFQSANSQGAIDFAKQVEALGKEYFATYGTYKFLQRNREGSKFQPYFISGKAEQGGE